MNDNSHQHGIKESVLEKIKKGDVRMRPKVYFALKIGLLALVALCTLAVSAFLFSYIVFSIHASGRGFLLGFGSRGFFAFFALFPWFSLVADIGLLFLFEWLLHHFKFGYHRPFIYLFLVAASAVVAAGMIMNAASFHHAVFLQNERAGVPVIGPFYEHLRRTPPGGNVFLGQVLSIEGNIFTVRADDHDKDTDDGIRTVEAPPGADVSLYLKPGDEVFVAGDNLGDRIRAYGITKAPVLNPDENE